MMNSSANLRKAAVLLRTVDADTAAALLAQLSTDEAMALRTAMQGLGPIDPQEQADVLSEFRRERPPLRDAASRGVELSLSSHEPLSQPASPSTHGPLNRKRFEFLDGAPAKTLASYLAREHAQTIAVVLSHLPPERAATVLASLPEKTQADTMERLANLGDTDSEAVTVLENELAAWVKARVGDAGPRARHRESVTSILAAADLQTRDAIMARLKTHNPELARTIQPAERAPTPPKLKNDNEEYRVVRSIARRRQVNTQLSGLMSSQPLGPRPTNAPAPGAPALPQIDFDHLIHMDSRMLARLLEVADPRLLALALAGSNDDLVDRVCEQMPKRIAKAFRRELRRMGPTRLSDVESAQRAIADLAAQQIALRRTVAARGPHSFSV